MSMNEFEQAVMIEAQLQTEKNATVREDMVRIWKALTKVGLN